MSESETKQPGLGSARFSASPGLVTIGTATLLLFAVSAFLDGASVSSTSLSGMLPLASVLAIAGLGQMLVVQQGGIDLSVAGGISLAVVVVTHVPDGDDSKLPLAIALALLLAVGAGLINGVLIGVLGLNAIIATLGLNALLYGVVLQISSGRPRITTARLAELAGGSTAEVPHAVFFALGALGLVAILVKTSVAGRRFESVGANRRATQVAGLRVRTHTSSAYVWAQLLYCLAGIVLAGIVRQPTAYSGDTFLLPSIAVVVLGGTSLLGGRGFPLPTVIAALFLQQLIQLVSVLGVSPAISPLVQAGALAVGVSLYSVRWSAVLARLRPPSRPSVPVPS